MDAAGSFIGYYVSLACDNKSIYEGEVSDIDAALQLITLTHAHQLLPDGSAMKYPQITLTGNHINSLKIIREKINLSPTEEQSEPITMKVDCTTDSHRNKSPKFYNGEFSRSPTKTKKKNGCFSEEADKLSMYPDFNFEENLAKFDKEAVFNEMLQNSQDKLPGGIPEYDRKMKSQENVLPTLPVPLRQIKVPVEHVGKEYTTETGFIIPAITLALKEKLFAAAEKAGLNLQQLGENAGIGICQMALQLVGGSLRLDPKNNHQRPDIVVLAGCHTQGIQAICAARHLANHTVNVLLYLPENSKFMLNQVELFLKAGGNVIKSPRDLPTQPVDIIIDAMIGLESKSVPDWFSLVASWANQNKAPILSIDPCSLKASNETTDIKWSIAMGLPLIKAPKSGRLYLADLGIPSGVFSDVGIQYVSPFLDKFTIPLYEC